jgi:hypothetical protein
MDPAGVGAICECCSLPTEDGLNVAALFTGVDGNGVNGLFAGTAGSGVGGLLDGIKPRPDNIPVLLKGGFGDAGEASLLCTGGIPETGIGVTDCGILSTTGGIGGTICCCIPDPGGAEGATGPAYCSAFISVGGVEGVGATGPAY